MTDLSAEYLEVLRLIDEDGIEAKLTSAQYSLRDELEEDGYIYSIGDDYDFNYYLTHLGKDELNKSNPDWWKKEYKQREVRIIRLEQEASQIISNSDLYISQRNDRVAKIVKENREWIDTEMINRQKRLDQANANILNLKREFDNWVTDNRGRFDDN